MSNDPPGSPSDRRESERVDFQGRVLLRASGWEALNQYLTENLSTDGMFVEHPKPLPAGEQVELKVIDEDGKPLFEATGTVTWVREAREGSPLPAGMGIHFTWLSEGSKGAVERIVRSNPATRNRKIGGTRSNQASAAPAPPAPAPPAVAPGAPPQVEKTNVGAPPSEPERPPRKKPEPNPERPPRKKPQVVTPQRKARKASPLGFMSGLQAAFSQSSPAILIGVGIGVIALVAGVGLTVHFIGVQKTKRAYRDSLQADVKRLEEAVVALDTASAAFPEREKELASRERAERKAVRALTLSPQQVLTINRTVRRHVGTRQSRFRLASMSRSGKTDEGPLRRVTYDMELYGDLLRLNVLAKQLWAHDKAMIVQSFEVSTLSFNTTQCRVKARVHFYEAARVSKPPPILEPPGAYLSLLAEKPVPGEWEGLSNGDIDAAQEKLKQLRADLEERRSIAIRRANLDQRADFMAARKRAVDGVRERRNESRTALGTLMPQIATNAKNSADQVGEARIDPTGKLTIW